jgi:hypothetical protein
MNTTTTGPGTAPDRYGPDQDCDPYIAVSALLIGEAAEILALIARAAAAEPAIKPALARFLAGQGGDPAHAMSWLVTRAAEAAAGLGGELALAGISIDPVLDRYRCGEEQEW